MQRCELADECCVCDIPFCPYSDGDRLVDGLYPDEYGEYEDEESMKGGDYDEEDSERACVIKIGLPAAHMAAT